MSQPQLDHAAMPEPDEPLAQLHVDSFECVEVVTGLTEFHMEMQPHALRVGRAAGVMARHLDCSEAFVATIERAAVLHDIGMVGISRRVLLKPGNLTEDEREHVRRHTEIGRQLLAGKQSVVLSMAADIAVGHHERWDGRGYPFGTAGTEVPLSARITAVVDVFDTLTHERPWRPAWEFDRAVAEMSAQADCQFDSALVDTLFQLDLPALFGGDEATAAPAEDRPAVLSSTADGSRS